MPPSAAKPDLRISVYAKPGGSSLLVLNHRTLEVPMAVHEVVEILKCGVQKESAPNGAQETVKLLSGLNRLMQRESPGRQRDLVVLADEELLRCAGEDVIHALAGAVGAVRVVPAAAASHPADDVLVTLTGGFDLARFGAWEDTTFDRDLVWAPFFLTSTGAAYGPFVAPGTTPTIRDLAARWIATARRDERIRARLAPAVFTHESRDSGAAVHWALACFFADLAIWLNGGDALGSWRHVHLRADDLSTSADPVLPVPVPLFHPLPDTTASPLGPDDVVNGRTGIVTETRPIDFRTEMPRGLVYRESRTADMSRLWPWASNLHNAGSAWDDAAAAEAGAIGEAVERYCGNVIDRSALVHAGYDELVGRGAAAVDPRTLALFSPAQHRNPGFPFIEFTTSLPVDWVRGVSLVNGDEVLVPASLVFVNWNSGSQVMAPPLHPAHYPGIAAAPDWDAAVCNALEEVVERDSVAVWWLSGHRLPTSTGPVDEFVRQRMPAGTAMSVRFVPVPNRFGIPTVAAVVDDPRSGVLALGHATRATPEDAARKALLEAFGLLESAVDMQHEDGGFWDAYVPGVRQAVKPVRADRRYLDEYRSDFRDVTDLFCQLQIQLDPRARAQVVERWDDTAQVAWNSLPRLEERRPEPYLRRLAAAGYDPIVVDLTTPDVAATGWHAVRVLVPGLVPNFPTAFPPLGGGRVLTEPVALGWREQPVDEGEVWQFPIPYA